MKGFIKKLAVILAAAVVFSAIPFGAFAADPAAMEMSYSVENGAFTSYVAYGDNGTGMDMYTSGDEEFHTRTFKFKYNGKDLSECSDVRIYAAQYMVNGTSVQNTDMITMSVSDDNVLTVTANKTGEISVELCIDADGVTVAGHMWLMFRISESKPVQNEGSRYKNAVMRAAFAGAQEPLNFGEINGNISNADEGFTMDGKTLMFSAFGKRPGNYEAVTTNGQLYVATIYNTPVENDDIEKISVNLEEPTTLPKVSNGFFVFNYNYVLDNLDVFFIKADGKFQPVYILYGENNALADIPQDFSVTVDKRYAEYFVVEPSTVNGKKAIRIYPRTDIVVPAIIDTTIYTTEGNFALDMQKYPDEKVEEVNYGMTTWYDRIQTQVMLAGTDYRVIEVDENATRGQHLISFFYLTKGTNPTQKTADFVLPDMIDVSSLTIENSNPELLSITGLGTMTPPPTKNAITVFMTVNDITKAGNATVRISFKDKNGVWQQAYQAITVAPPVPKGFTFNVNSESAFELAYQQAADVKNYLEADTIVLGQGEYKMDIVMDKCVKIRGAEGEKVTIVGKDGSSNAIVTFMHKDINESGDLQNVIIDGKGTRTGVAVGQVEPGKGAAGQLVDCTVRNCTTGFDAGSVPHGIVGINYPVFENCETAVKLGNGYVDIENGIFTRNDTAIDNASTSTDTSWRIVYNKFVRNDKDVVSTANYVTDIRQNYFGNKPEVEKTGAGGIFYSPYYRMSNKEITIGDVAGSVGFELVNNSIVVADIAGAQRLGTRAVTENIYLPLDTSIDSTTTFDTGLFDEMKTVKAEEGTAVSVTIDVKEKQGGDLKTTAMWGFDNADGSLVQSMPDEMDLEINRQLSSKAQNIVADRIENTEDVIGYVHFEHDGILPGKATVKIPVTEAEKDKINVAELKLFYINEDGETVKTEAESDVTIEQIDGVDYYVMTVSHCSEYIIATDIQLKAVDNTGDTSGSGDTTSADSSQSNTGAASQGGTQVSSADNSQSKKPAPSKTESTVKDESSSEEQNVAESDKADGTQSADSSEDTVSSDASSDSTQPTQQNQTEKAVQSGVIIFVVIAAILCTAIIVVVKNKKEK